MWTKYIRNLDEQKCLKEDLGHFLFYFILFLPVHSLEFENK